MNALFWSFLGNRERKGTDDLCAHAARVTRTQTFGAELRECSELRSLCLVVLASFQQRRAAGGEFKRDWGGIDPF